MTSTVVLNITCEVIGGKWRMAVLYSLQKGPLRFSEIKEHMPGCSVKVLSSVLKELTDNKLLIRLQYQTIPVKVTYELHPNARLFARDLHNLYLSSCAYVVQNAEHLQVSKHQVDRILLELQ